MHFLVDKFKKCGYSVCTMKHTYNLELLDSTARYTCRLSALGNDRKAWEKEIKIALQFIYKVSHLIYKIELGEARRGYIENYLATFENILIDREDTLSACDGYLPENYDDTVQCGIINTARRLRSAIHKVMPRTL